MVDRTDIKMWVISLQLVETSESQRAKKHLSEMETVSGADYAVGSSGLFRNKKHGRRGGDWTPRGMLYWKLFSC